METEIRLQYISTEGLTQLKHSFKNNINEYKNNNQQFFLDYLNDNGYLLDSVYCVSDFLKNLKFTGNNDSDDLHNIQVVYDAMKHIPAYIMMDERFWAGINHTIMWDYILKRREGEAFGENIIDQNRGIFNSFFTDGKKRGTFVNCVSRLWWAGKLTYEINEPNHYLLTEELCKKGFPSTIVPFSSSNIMGKEELRKGILMVVKKIRETGIDVKRNDILWGIRYLNLVGGSSMIDYLSFEEVVDMLKKFYTNFYSSNY